MEVTRPCAALYIDILALVQIHKESGRFYSGLEIDCRADF